MAQQYAMLQSSELQAGFVRMPLSYRDLFKNCLVLVTLGNEDFTPKACLKKHHLLQRYVYCWRGLNAQT